MCGQAAATRGNKMIVFGDQIGPSSAPLRKEAASHGRSASALNGSSLLNRILTQVERGDIDRDINIANSGVLRSVIKM
ncbi:hypothetical protein VTN77DRAFT_523 [Rasamsonia byssochlamydoides]|uniref:uncharacterized protein n=1 Tax=Rasamsonia byssochlamydoides TaxID=89139 RepID=UPI0037435D2E